MTKGDFAVTRLDKFVVETSGVKNSVDFSLNNHDALERYGVDINGEKKLLVSESVPESLLPFKMVLHIIQDRHIILFY